MKRITLFLIFICLACTKTFSQVDPCYVLKEVLLQVDQAVVQGKYDDALKMLEKVKNDSRNKQCPEFKNGIIDYKIKDVKEKINKRDGGKCPDNHHPHAIDLGLPSGTKWACCNVGANKPEAYGSYFAWGETIEKTVYNDVTYKYSTGKDKDGDGIYDKNDKYQDIGLSICGTQYDVAHLKWGGSWMLPSSEQMKELIDECKYELTTVNGVKGARFTSPNGRSIFLPAAGHHYKKFYQAGEKGEYWSGTLHSRIFDHTAITLEFQYSTPYHTRELRSCGISVRPVKK